MKRDLKPLVGGALLVLAGGLWLMDSMGIVRGKLHEIIGSTMLLGLSGLFALLAIGNVQRRAGFLVPSGVLAAGGIVVLGDAFHFLPQAMVPLLVCSGFALPLAAMFLLDRRRGWALILAWIAAAIGVGGFLEELGSWTRGFLPLVILWGIAAPFLIGFLRRGNEGYLVPAGLFFTLGIVRTADELQLFRRHHSALFFLGMAITFLLVHVLGRPGQSAWARYPALLSFVLAVAFFVKLRFFAYGIPLALIVTGAYLILGARDNGAVDGSSAPPPRETPPAAPTPSGV